VTSIDFYFNAEDRFQVACRLAGKALAQEKRLLIYAPDPQAATRIDRMLWTWPAIGFVPHCALHDPLAGETPVLIASAWGAREAQQELGAQASIEKPFDPDVLLGELQRILEPDMDPAE